MEAGLDNTMPNSAAYIASWYKKLADDPKLFWTAAGKAQKAADLILNRVKEWEPSDS
jgi:antirestriction protein ArdC